ncbi:uncharacterized protein LOC107045035 [Diachasma alloeum]|uniref:uncharacterized protein LOC107045035 n=1 Tax=Diachasma alloeum TaxID=454923 RepID=UPI00073834B3|nr:uncharacterized protein LOC107045035 [Diachasma alloeum]
MRGDKGKQMKMSDTTENNKYKWTPESTTLLVSVWTDRQVQKQLEYAVKPQLIWESIAKYMRKKGYGVTARQCRSRMKQVLVCYREAKKTGTRAGVERYYESIDKVLENKRLTKGETDAEREAETDAGGVDTVDSGQFLLKSPEKEIKTHANFLMRRNKLEEPPEPLVRQIEIDPGPWSYLPHDYYADSSESNETVLARPHRSLSPTVLDPRINLVPKALRSNMGKVLRRSLPEDHYRYNTLEANRFSEMPLKNTAQNVQNQIIQENMLLKNQLCENYMSNQGLQQPPNGPQSMDYCLNMGNIPQPPRNHPQDNILYYPTRHSTNLARIQSQLQQCALTERLDNPQQAKSFVPLAPKNSENINYKIPLRPQTSCHPDIAPNLNEAFYQAKISQQTKAHNLNETYDQDTDMFPVNTTMITNNATFNDDTLSIEFIQDSPSPSENGLVGSKNDSPNPPHAPFRKKKAQKLEQLMLSAITSQTEVVNKILAAQDSMVARILDRDQTRQDRLENRLDQLMNVVHATVLNKSGSGIEKSGDNTPPNVITSVPLCFSPPPKPGTVPPKLDLVPPKPCRVPCTSPSSNIEVITQNSVTTRPGVIRPCKPGTIWSKLGPVSASPFVQAQKEMNTAAGVPPGVANEWKTKSSAERRIELGSARIFQGKVAMEETQRFLQAEKLMEERIENARQIFFGDDNKKPDTQPARRKLFNLAKEENKEKREIKCPSAARILTSNFLDIERQAEERSRYFPIFKYKNEVGDELLSGHGEGYERLRNLDEALGLNTSTPAKVETKQRSKDLDFDDVVPKQTIQQLAQLVMQSARWKQAASRVEPISSAPPAPPLPSALYENYAQRQGYNKARDWLEDRYTYGIEKQNYEPQKVGPKKYPVGFVNPRNYPENENEELMRERQGFKSIGFNGQVMPLNRRGGDDDFLEKERMIEARQRYSKGNYVVSRKREPSGKYGPDGAGLGEAGKNTRGESDVEDNDEYLDTTTTLKPYRKTSLTSNGTSGTGTGKNAAGCAIS